MDLGIRGRRALVNGGSAGMGKGTVRALALEGVELFVSARGEERLAAACSEISHETGAQIIPIVADHSTAEGRAKILEACPAPDILVHTCSPPQVTGDYLQIDNADWQASLDTTLLGPVQFMKAVIPGMVERQWGRIVNIGTAAAKYPTQIRILSGAPRAALTNYTVAVSKAVARHNVMINNILPGMFHTAGIEDNFNAMADAQGKTYDEVVEDFVRQFRIPAGKFGDADDLGKLTAVFCSEFANYLVGQSLAVDGGVTNSTF